MKTLLILVTLLFCSCASASYPRPNRIVTVPQRTPPQRFAVSPLIRPIVQPVAPPVVAPPILSAESTFTPITKAELLTVLQKSLENAERDRFIVFLGGAASDSGPVRYFDGRLEAFRTALEFAELLPDR